MASQGQRFRRKALRRGYKVDEVDEFLDRVEATLAGEQVGAPVASQEVHDVVFRVRFNGYDEWQVDLHLDRVERQLAELEERRPAGRPGDPRLPDRMGPPNRMGPPDRFGPPDRMGPPERMGPPDRFGPPERMGPPDRFGQPEPMGSPDRFGQPEPMGSPDRFGPHGRDDRGVPPMQPPLPPRPMPAQAGPQDPYSRYDEPTGVFGGAQDGPRGDFDGPGGMRGPAGPGRPGLPGRPGGAPVPPGAGPRGPEGYDPEERFNGFEPGRHGKMDMTAEIRLPDRDPRGGGRGPAGPPAIAGPPMGGPPMGGPGLGVPAVGGPGGDLHRVDQIRRTFQVRRFGSGYDPDQVDRMFDEILSSMAGRGPMPVTPADLDAPRFGLVPGGYFEAEVDAALKEVKDIIFRR